MAPVAAAISWNSSGPTKSASWRPAPQSITWPAAAMKPSSEIHLFTTTLPFPVLVSLICSSQRQLTRTHTTGGSGLPLSRPARTYRSASALEQEQHSHAGIFDFRGDRLWRHRVYLDRAEGLRAAGLSEWTPHTQALEGPC